MVWACDEQRGELVGRRAMGMIVQGRRMSSYIVGVR